MAANKATNWLREGLKLISRKIWVAAKFAITHGMISRNKILSNHLTLRWIWQKLSAGQMYVIAFYSFRALWWRQSIKLLTDDLVNHFPALFLSQEISFLRSLCVFLAKSTLLWFCNSRNHKWRHLTAKGWTTNVLPKKAQKEAFAAGMRPVLDLILKVLIEIFHLVGAMWVRETEL